MFAFPRRFLVKELEGKQKFSNFAYLNKSTFNLIWFLKLKENSETTERIGDPAGGGQTKRSVGMREPRKTDQTVQQDTSRAGVL